MRACFLMTMWFLGAAVCGQSTKQELAKVEPVKYQRIDFEAIDRNIAKLPEFVGPEQRYGLFLFGRNGEKKVWAVLDRSEGRTSGFDRLHLDVNANGDLTDEGELFEGQIASGSARTTFKVGWFTDPGTAASHTDFEITWQPASKNVGEWTRYRMKWRGDKITMGPYGPYHSTYQGFAKTPKGAPVLVPGYDRPFEFEYWMCEKLKRGSATEFKVFVGNRGDRTGTFSCVDDKFLKKKDSPEATLLFEDVDGKKRRVHVKLTERC